MKTDKFEVGPFAENSYLLKKSGEAILIDPGFSSESEYQSFKKTLKSSETELKYIILTHAHIDHVMGLNRVREEFDVPVYLNHTDLELWKNFRDQAAMFGFNLPDFDFIPEPLKVQKGFQLGKFSFDVLYTPGHSPDHVSLYFPDAELVIAGDALFRESIGRTDLYKGSFDRLAKSIREELYTLPDHTEVLPGHGPKTTIGHEKMNNAFVKP